MTIRGIAMELSIIGQKIVTSNKVEQTKKGELRESAEAAGKHGLRGYIGRI
jgi:hypothetical protein